LAKTVVKKVSSGDKEFSRDWTGWAGRAGAGGHILTEGQILGCLVLQMLIAPATLSTPLSFSSNSFVWKNEVI
jgi:hypothetical protein